MFKRSSNPLGKVACEPKKTYPSEETGTNASSNLEPRTKTPINAETTTNTKLSDATTTNSKLSDAASATTNINLSDASTITNTKSSDASKTTNPRSSDGSKGTNAKSSDATSTNLKTSDASKPTNLKLSDASGTINPKLSDGVLSTNAELSDTSKTTNTKSCDAKITDSYSSISRGGTSSIRSNSIDSALSGPLKPHTGGDGRWDAIQLANSRDSPLRLSHFRLLKRLGYGDIGSVYLVELRGTDSFFAMKVMDKASLASRNKILRAQTEREILALLDHPFLPTLYSYFETDKFYCLVMEYCSGGNLHSLRQRQPNGYFTEQAARFYASEVLLALEYLHMLGVIYRDLKPENVLVRDGGHIMLSDFDLSLRCSVSPTLVKSSSAHGGLNGGHGILDNDFAVTGCIQPSAFFPRILPKKNRKSKSDFSVASGALELMAEPTNARSMSFVGTHEYLAPEIICGEGHGSAVDWWTFGIFLYELLHGMTPFKGAGNRATLYNVVGQPLRFPDAPSVSTVARDLIRGLLVKDPQKRIAYKRGATEIKQHPFFEGVNWALVRSTAPPHVPEPVDFTQFASKDGGPMDKKGGESAGGGKKLGSSDSSHLDFEYF